MNTLLKTAAVLIGLLLIFSATIPLPSVYAVEHVKAGTREVNRGWGSSSSSIFEELWSYIIHGHGVRHTETVWEPVEDDVPDGSTIDDLQENPPEEKTKGGGSDSIFDDDPIYIYDDYSDMIPSKEGDETPGAPVPEPLTFVLLAFGGSLTLLSKLLFKKWRK